MKSTQEKSFTNTTNSFLNLSIFQSNRLPSVIIKTSSVQNLCNFYNNKSYNFESFGKEKRLFCILPLEDKLCKCVSLIVCLSKSYIFFPRNKAVLLRVSEFQSPHVLINKYLITRIL